MGRTEHFAAGADTRPSVSFKHTSSRGMHTITANHSELGEVGKMQYRALGDALEVGGIEVHPDVQAKGIGTKMASLALRHHAATSISTDSLTRAGRNWGDAVERHTGATVESTNERYGQPDDYDEEDRHR